MKYLIFILILSSCASTIPAKEIGAGAGVGIVGSQIKEKLEELANYVPQISTSSSGSLRGFRKIS